MPNGDTVRVELPDGRTGTIPKSSLAQAKEAGWKVVGDSSFHTFEKAVAGGMGFDPEKLQKYGAPEALREFTKGTGEWIDKSFKDPYHLMDPVHALASGITAGGKELLGGQFATGAGHLMGSLAGVGAGVDEGAAFGDIVSTLKKIPEKTGAASKGALRGAFGAGKGDVRIKTEAILKEEAEAQQAHTEKIQKIQQDHAEKTQKAIDDHAEKVAKAQEKHVEQVQKLTDKHEEQVAKVQEKTSAKMADVLKKRAEASAKETAAKTKQEALVSKHGPVYKRINEMADEAQQHVTKMEEKVNAAESAKWDAFKNKMGDAPVQTADTVDAIAHANEKILTGESLPVFKQILNEISEDDPLAQASVFSGGKGVDIKEFLRNAAPAVRERMIRDLQAQGIDESTGFTARAVDIPLDTARRLYTKISRKLNASELPRDVARALGMVQDTLDGSIAESIAKKGGPQALGEYRELQADWKQYRQTFSDKDSPLRKIVEAKDPNTKLGPITSETGARAVDYLGRYRDMGAQPEKLGRIRALNKSLRELPGGGGVAPEKVSGMKLPEKPKMPPEPQLGQPKLPPSPELPTAPEKRSVAPEDVRKQILQQKAMSFSQPLSKWEMMNPKLLIFRKLLKHLIQSPSFVDWLSRSGGNVVVPGGEARGVPLPLKSEESPSRQAIEKIIHGHDTEED